MEEAVI